MSKDMEGLRDIACCVRAMKEMSDHMAIRGRVSGSTLTDANEKLVEDRAFQ